MSYNGSGTFVINTAGQPVVSGTVISSTAFNALTADLATGLSTAITKDGQTTPTANIPMGNNKITGLAVGTAATDAANLSQVQSTAAKLVGSVSGVDTITGTMSPTLAAYAAGQMFYFVAASANTGAVTINIDSLGAKSITRDGTTALAAGDIQSGEVCVIVYDGTQFQLVNGASQSASIVTENLTVNKATVLNESGGDNDTRIEGDTDANLFFADASTDRIGIGTSSPAGKVHAVASTAGTTSLFERSTASTAVPVFASRSLATSSGDMADGFGPTHAFAIQDGAAVINPISEIGAVREGADNSGGLVFRTYSAGTATTQMRLDKAGNLGLGVTPSAWSGDKAFQLTGNSVLAGGTNVGTIIGQNMYFDGSVYKYIASAAANMLQFSSSEYLFRRAASGTAGNTITFTTALTLNANGNLVLQGGSTGANGIGVTFPASQSASSDANCLDDYEEGTFTPTLTAESTAPTGVTYTARVGRYVKIGRVVQIEMSLHITSIGTGGSGTLAITGLPFTSATVTDHFPNFGIAASPLSAALAGQLSGQINNNSAAINLVFNTNTTTGLSAASYSSAVDGMVVRVSTCYQVA